MNTFHGYKVRGGNSRELAEESKSPDSLRRRLIHDLNNLLAVVVATAQVIEDELPSGSEFLKDTKEIVKAGQRASGLVQQIRALSADRTGATVSSKEKPSPCLSPVSNQTGPRLAAAPGMGSCGTGPIRVTGASNVRGPR